MGSNLYSFTLIVTEDCNFNCSYCYQKKSKKYIETSTIKKALDFFFPKLAEECYINFHGGEPLLAFDQIREALGIIQAKNKSLDKKVHFATVTNGSLLDDHILRFFHEHKFSLLLSFDGLLQDISRKRGSSQKIVKTIDRLLDRTNIELEVCNVFTPETVPYLSESIQSIMNLGVKNIHLTLSNLRPWSQDSLLQLKKELELLNKMLISIYEQSEVMPVLAFRKNFGRGIFHCAAGQDRMAITPEGKLWGCYLFPDLFKDKVKTAEYNQFCFGDIDPFIEDYKSIFPEISRNYSNLRMDRFSMSEVSCRDCPELRECIVCPISAALSGYPIYRVPEWTCQIKKILRAARKNFWREFDD